MRLQSKDIIAKNLKTSFMSVAKDQEAIWKKLLVDSDYKNLLKRLLVINTEDCLDLSNQAYSEDIENFSIHDLIDKGYIRIIPRLEFGEHEEVKSYILLEFDDFVPTENPEFRDCVISFTIICHLDHWGLDDYQLRPHLIAGYVDGIMNQSKLSGIGTLNFIGASQIVLNEYLGGLVLRYLATHGSDDETPTKDVM